MTISNGKWRRIVGERPIRWEIFEKVQRERETVGLIQTGSKRGGF